MTQHKTIVQRTVQAGLQAFGVALVEILMPKATFVPFKRDNDNVNEAAKEDKDRNSVTLLTALDACAPIQGTLAAAGKEDEAKSDDDEFTFLFVRQQSVMKPIFLPVNNHSTNCVTRN